MAGPGVPYPSDGWALTWVGLVTPCELTTHDFSETFDHHFWTTPNTFLAYELMPAATGKLTLDTWLSSYPGFNETDGATHPAPGSLLWSDVALISGATYVPGSGVYGGLDDESYGVTINVTSGVMVKLRAAGGVMDADYNDLPDQNVHLRLRTGDIVSTGAANPSPNAWTPTVTWPDPPSDVPRTVVVSSLPGRRRFRPR